MEDRDKLYPDFDELEQLGFKKRGEGDDPRDYSFEVDLANPEASENKPVLMLDAYFDFSLTLPELMESIPLNFQSIAEIENFIKVFKRPYNHAFSGLLDILKD